MRSILLYLTCMLAFALPASAQEYTFDAEGDSVTADFNGISGAEGDVGTLIDGLSASMTLLLDSMLTDEGITTWVFSVTLENTSSGAGVNTGIDANITALGFNTSDTILTSDAGDVYFVETYADGNFPNIGILDMCITGANGSCTGGQGGIAEGNFETFTLTLTTDALDVLILSDFGLRYQGITGGIYDGDSGIGLVTEIPEPATWLMMIIGFGIVSASARRSKRHTSVKHA